MAVLEVTDQNFADETGTGLTVTNFHATWCGSCQMMTPVISKLAEEMNGTVKFANMDMDQNPYVARYYGIKSLPTMLVRRDGKVVKIIVGVRSVSRLRAEIKQLE